MESQRFRTPKPGHLFQLGAIRRRGASIIAKFQPLHPKKKTTILGFVGKEKMCQIFACYFPSSKTVTWYQVPGPKGTRFVYKTPTTSQRLNSASFHSTPSDWKIPSKASIRVNFFFASWQVSNATQPWKNSSPMLVGFLTC